MTEPSVRTLVVDDDVRAARLHAHVISRTAGFEVAAKAHSAAEALEAVDALRPDLVLMDIRLPDVDGLQVLLALMDRDDPPDSMVVTAVRDLHTVTTAMRLGAVHYLIKPFGRDALRDRLTSYLRLRNRMAVCGEEADQSDVDALFRLRSPVGPATPERTALDGPTPPPTCSVVREAVLVAPGAVSACEVAIAVGISRATAQRHLSRLVESGDILLQLRYGASGRPVHCYRPADSDTPAD